MQWHPLFVDLLSPVVEEHYEVRTGQTVGELPRWADVVVMRRTTAGTVPYRGIWRWLTSWNVLEYKGPTVSARLDDVFDLVELGLGIHRRLNEIQQKEQQGQKDRAETTWWYLAPHLGRRLQADLVNRFPSLRQEISGVWRGLVVEHPLVLVSVQDLAVDRDSLPLHVLAGVPETERSKVAKLLSSEPHLWPRYGAWLSGNETALFQELLRMVAQQSQDLTLKLGPLADFLRQGGRLEDMKDLLEAFGVKQAVEAVGVKQAVEAVGVKQVVEAMGVKQAVEAVGVKQVVEAVGVKQVWENLSPQERQDLLRLAQQEAENTSPDSRSSH